MKTTVSAPGAGDAVCPALPPSAEADQTARIAIQAEELVDLLPRTARRLFRLDPDNPSADIPVAQLRACAILQAGPLTISSLSDELGVSVSAATQIVDRMERAGLAERGADELDRRHRHVCLTPHGTAIMCGRHSVRVRQAFEALSRLSECGRAQAIEALRSLVSAADGPDSC